MNSREMLNILIKQEETSPLFLLVEELRERYPDKEINVSAERWHMTHRPEPFVTFWVYVSNIMNEQFKSCDKLVNWWWRRKLIFKKF